MEGTTTYFNSHGEQSTIAYRDLRLLSKIRTLHGGTITSKEVEQARYDLRGIDRLVTAGALASTRGLGFTYRVV